jgi:hypothetical protein
MATSHQKSIRGERLLNRSAMKPKALRPGITRSQTIEMPPLYMPFAGEFLLYRQELASNEVLHSGRQPPLVK